jgi:hypothetical protein
MRFRYKISIGYFSSPEMGQMAQILWGSTYIDFHILNLLLAKEGISSIIILAIHSLPV